MTVPKNVQSYFPGLISFIEKIGVTYIKVTSGFQGGVRDIRTIEDELMLAGFDYVNPHLSQKDPPFDLVLERMPEICRRFSDSLYRKPSKKEVWLSGIESEDKINVPKRLKAFEESYHSTQQG